MVSIHRPQAAWPSVFDAEIALTLTLDFVALLIYQYRHDTKERECGTAWLLWPGIREGGDHVGAGLCLPPGVYDGAAAVANDIMIPPPCLGYTK